MEPRPLRSVPGPGEVLGGKYVVERRLAEGGMGVVLAARHARLGHRVAIKVLHPETRTMPEIAGRFEREARAAAQIRSRNVARVIDVEALPDGSPFMVMELLEGHDLGVELEERGKLPPVQAVGYALAACAGMAEAHRLGIVHRDLKPSNLFLAVEGDEHVLKVLDFGISKLTADVDTKMTATNSVLGTPLYMSPEQVRSAKNVDARTDIWSLGVILYEMLSGELPFIGESATAVAASIVADDVIPLASRCADLPEGLAEVVMKALSKKPAARFQDIGELAAALQPFDGTTRARPASTLIRVTPISAGEVSAEAQTVAGAAGEHGVSSTPPPKEVFVGASKTAPGWTGGGSIAPSGRAGKRWVILGGVVLIGGLGLAATVRSLRTDDGISTTPAAMVAPSHPVPALQTPSITSDVSSTAEIASAPLVFPAPSSSATTKSSATPQPRSLHTPTTVPTQAPAAPQTPEAPRSPPATGLPSHI